MTELAQQMVKSRFVSILGSSRSGGSISFASKAVGFSRQTIATWRKLDADFDRAVGKALMNGKAILADEAEHALLGLIRKGNATAIIFTLKSLRAEKWNIRYTRPMTSHDGKIEDLYTISPEFRQALNDYSQKK